MSRPLRFVPDECKGLPPKHWSLGCWIAILSPLPGPRKSPVYTTDELRNFLTASRANYSNGFTLSGILAGFTVSGFVELLPRGQSSSVSEHVMFIAFLCSSVCFIFSLLSALTIMMSITHEIRDAYFHDGRSVLSEDKYRKMMNLGSRQIHFFGPFLLGLLALFAAVSAAGFRFDPWLGFFGSGVCVTVIGISARFGYKLLK